jgi:predicted acylesterase/phospholipase RssA
LAAVLFAVGYEAFEVSEMIASPFRLIRGTGDHSINGADAVRMIEEGALFSHDPLVRWIDRKIRERLSDGGNLPNRPVTFRDLAERSPQPINCFVFSSNDEKGLIVRGFAHGGKGVKFVDRSDDYSVATAVVASLAIPFVFDPPSDLSAAYLDGGLNSNFPIAATQRSLAACGVEANIVGVAIEDEGGEVSAKGVSRTLASVLKALTTARDSQDVDDLSRRKRLLVLGAGPVSTLDFHVASDGQAAMVEHAWAKTASFALDHLVKAHGGLENIPALERPLHRSTGRPDWPILFRTIEAQISSSKSKLQAIDVSSGKPSWIRIFGKAAIALVLARYWFVVVLVCLGMVVLTVYIWNELDSRVDADVLEREFVSRDIVDQEYLRRDHVEAEYVPRSELLALRNQSAQSFRSNMLLQTLLADVGRRTSEFFRELPMNACRPDLKHLVSPRSRAELLAYLGGPGVESRGLAALAFASCSQSLDDAYHLAKTLREVELEETRRDFVSALCRILVASDDYSSLDVPWLRTQLRELSQYVRSRADRVVADMLDAVDVEALIARL